MSRLQHRLYLVTTVALMVVVSFLVHLVVILAIAFQLYRRQTLLKPFFWPALIVKLIAGVSLGLLYRYYYSDADTFLYFRDASKLVALAETDLSAYVELMFNSSGIDAVQLANEEPRTLFLTKITSIFCLLTGKNYWASGLYFSFISFLGSWFLAGTIARTIPAARMAAIVALLFFPSAVFWSSGILKETVAVPALFYITAIFLNVWFKERTPLWQWLIVPLAFWILWTLKYYYAGVFIAVTGATIFYVLIVRRRVSFKAIPEFFTWCLLLILPIVLVSLLHPNFRFHRLLSVVAVNNEAYVSLSQPGDFVEFYDLSPSAGSMLLNAPLALFSGLFRPLFWEASSVVQVLASVENTLLLLFFTGALFRAKSYAESPYRLLILTTMVYIVLLCVFITLSAPNFGTLSRYRTGYISFFTLLILCNNPVLQYVERTIMRLVSK